MKSAFSIAILFLTFNLVCLAGDKTCPTPEPGQDSKFRPGQVWKYKTRPSEGESLVTILKIESLPKGIIVHVRVDRVHIKNCSGGPELETVEHMPFMREALDRSLTKLLKESSTTPDFQAG
jgi:hypothetical protein